MVFDPEEYEKAKKLYLLTLLDAVEELRETHPDTASDASLCEREIAERSKVPRHLIDRASEDLSNAGMVQCCGGLGPIDGREYYFTNHGLTEAEKLRFDKSWKGRGRKLEKAVKGKMVEGASSLASKVFSGIAIYLAGVLSGYYGPWIGGWLKGLLGIK